LRLSLLRAGTTPDAEQDQGKHEFSWAVLPHVGSFLESDVPIAAYFFNSPLHALYVPQDLPIPSVVHKRPFNVENAPNVVLSGVKRGDDDEFDIKSKSGSIVLRLYEAYGGHAKARLRM
jgi:alpha-mannosidase